ncbi:glycoside hydrolase family 35 protein [Amanita thiersii Skay4041]|uniref:Beta-galactosidase n=1 Tax=Amanita thiersii Skay4041 TaxID=703135 RepID=A0A2A9NRI3_9AGAR|nr:glycoside hydrolase family 35 protein [Amanita thiersii Skay4041]
MLLPVQLASRRNSTGLTDTVTWDPHSLSILGQRIFILSAEFHPWRVPGNPNLWADIFQKIKANGFNTVSFYINWAVHYPTPSTNNGNGDFQSGTYRDIQRFIDEAKKAGLWMIARPGPYINGETTGGGFPGWVGNVAGPLRTDSPGYMQTWTPYMTAISKIIAQNQISNGGPIVLVQAENEYSASTSNNIYMQAIIDLYRANGIVVPIIHNDQHAGQAGNFSPDRPGTHVDIYCGDSYPQGSNRWAQVQAIYYSAHEAVAPSNPLCLAEFGGGFLLSWGAAAVGGTGYEKFLLFGGTNWGQTLEPTVYSSYDYGGGINENRVATSKMNEMRLQGLFLRVSRDLLSSDLLANGTNYTTSSLIHTAELRNSASGAAFYITRHNDSTSTALTTTKLTILTSAGQLLVPKAGSLTFNGRESKIIVTDYVFGRSRNKILYSTAEVMTWTTIGITDYIILYAPSGQTGETVMTFTTAPVVNVTGLSNVSSSFSNGMLTLSYSLSGSQFIPITSGNGSLVVIIMDKATANNWHAPVLAQSGTFGNYFSIGTNDTVLVGGPYIMRTAEVSQDTLKLTGDLNGTTTIEFVAPAAVTALTWNGASVGVTRSNRGSFTATLADPSPITLPSLTNWKVSGSLPEIDPKFDDSSFVTADLTTTNYTNLPPLAGDKVLYSQQYGFYGGNLIFRGHFTATGSETSIVTTVQSGFAGGYSAWLNGNFLGSSQGSPTVSVTTDTWNITQTVLRPGQDNVFVIIQANGGKEPRGIRGYSIVGSSAKFNQWKLQGNLGGAAKAPDTLRGYLNEGGLYAERIGAHLPGFPDSSWTSGSPIANGVKGAGVNFYRTTFDLNLPDGVDVPIRLQITPAPKTSNFRVQIYLNGWQVGKYINNIGPQTLFAFPASILRRKSTNTLGLSLWSLDGSGASIPGLQLVSDGTFSTSLVFEDYVTPDYAGQQQLRPTPTFVSPM